MSEREHAGRAVPRPRRRASGSREAAGFEWLARAGLVARGVVYGIIGVLAVKLAFGDGGKTTDQQGALQRSPAVVRQVLLS